MKIFFSSLFMIILMLTPMVQAKKIEYINHPLFGEIVPNQLLVRYKKSSYLNAQKKALKKSSKVIKSEYFMLKTMLYEFNNQTDFENEYLQFKNDNNISIVQPNYIYKADFNLPTDPDYTNSVAGKQWALAKIECDKAWQISAGINSDIIVAVLDTGIDTTHPDFWSSGKVDSGSRIFKNTDEIPYNGIDDDNNGYIDDYIGFDFIDGERISGTETDDPEDDKWKNVSYGMTDMNGHGTWTSGIIGMAVNNDTYGAGIFWGGKILPVRVLGASDDDGKIIGTTTTITYGIYYAVKMNAKIINMSLGGYSYDRFAEEAVSYAYDRGIVLIAAAGNDDNKNDDNHVYPADYLNVISVGATNLDDERVNKNFTYWGSNYGWTIDLYAPGQNIYGPKAKNVKEYGMIVYWNGTSAAAPVVSGVAALILSVKPSLSPAEVKNILVQSCDYPVTEDPSNANKGRVNAFNALKMIQLGWNVADKDRAAVIAQPNPFRIGITGEIRFVPVNNTSSLVVEIYTLSGYLVKRLGKDDIYYNNITGDIETKWNGIDRNGSKAAPGTYLYHALTDSGKWLDKFTVINW